MRVYRASSLGYSLEALVAGHLGFQAVDPPEYLQAAFDEGNRIEPLALDKYRAHFINGFIDSEQKEVELEVIPGLAKVVGHLDGIHHFDNGPGRVLEVKSMNGRMWGQVQNNGFNAGGIMEKYKWQISAYMLATGLEALMVFWNKDDGEISVLRVDEPFYSISDIANKLQQAEDHISTGTIPDGCTDYPCPYFYLHAEKDIQIDKADEVLDGLLDSWLEADKKVKIYEKERDGLKASILEFVGTEGAAKVVGEQGVTVSVSWQEGGEVIQKRQPKWVTKIQGPRGKSATS